MRASRLLPFFLVLLAAVQPRLHAETVVIEGAHVFDGERNLGEQAVVIRDGRIAYVGAEDAADPALVRGARKLDYRGKYLMPGLVSDHAHVGNSSGVEHGDRFYTRDNVVRDLRQFQAYGITTVTALGMNGPAFYAIRAEVDRDPALGAQLKGAGPGIGVPGGAPPAETMGLAHDPVARPADADAARAAVRAQADAGADLIKLWVDDLGGQRPMMAPAVYRAAIEEAHKRGLKVAAHIHDLAPAADLVASGLDILAHGVRDQPIGPDLVKAMFAAGTWYIPTVTLDEAVYYYAEHPKVLQQPFLRNALSPPLRAQWNDANWRRTRLADPSVPVAHQAVATNLANLRTLRDAGIRIGFGTDAGALPQRVIGFAEHRELELMVQAGFSPSQALTTATRDASKLLGLKDRGRIVPGLRADLLVLDADPTRDILNTRRIVAVWQAGVEVGGKIEDYRPR